MAEAVAAVAGINQQQQGASIVTPVSMENNTPFQVMLDSAVSGLREVSAIEEKANAYISQYARGNVSMEEVMIEVSKMTMAVQLATTVVNQTVSTFKEIQQMPV